MNKKIISILMIMMLILTGLLTGCQKGNSEPPAQETLRNALLNEFSEISKIPRDTNSDMKSITAFIIKKLKGMGLNPTTDKNGNIIVSKSASKGYENSKTTILHTNIDMLAEYNPSVLFNKEKDPITPLVNEDTERVIGNNTSLGASSGLGMAAAFYILENSTEHGSIRVIFTVDGEKDMSGAQKLSEKYLEGDYLIDLNNNQSGNIETESAYSTILNCSEKIQMNKTQNKYSFVLVADGFKGGDSGFGAQNEQGNPIKFLAQVLAVANGDGLSYELNDFTGGDNPYDIPHTATATITVNEYEKSKINSVFNKVSKTYLKNYSKNEQEAQLKIIETTVPDKALDKKSSGNLISFLYGITDGKYNEKSYTTASSNVGMINIGNKKTNIKIFAQGKYENTLDRIISEHSSLAKISGITIDADHRIKGFSVDGTNELTQKISRIYADELDIQANMSYRPTRSELGFFQEKAHKLQMISLGPSIRQEDTIEEYVELPTIDLPVTAVMKFLSDLNEE